MKHEEVAARCSYPGNLPVSARSGEIIEAIKKHQVLIVAGHTGSGKTTQLPKMCIQAGYGRNGQIAHTQPRRLAAITVAERLAEEMNSELGEIVGYQIRFDKQYAAKSVIKLQTDGVLLNEIQADPLLQQYDCIIIDEAHERSLNIDFLLGYLGRLLPRRPELRLIITSATIDTAKFSEFFSDAPIIEVSGQTFPVETRYRPFEREEQSVASAIYWAVSEIEGHVESTSLDADSVEEGAQGKTREETGTSKESLIVESDEALDSDAETNAESKVENKAESTARKTPNAKNKLVNLDVLCFLSTEQEITDAARYLRGKLEGRFEVLPLYARLPAKQQRRVFKAEKNAPRRLILATNIAETSVTVPRIGFVIDGGESRMSRYSYHSKIQQLPIEAVSQASANQRLGRCGRLGPGVCIRLYSEQDFSERELFTEPEILRTNLAAVILKLYSIGINDIHSFEFLDAPDDKLLRDGVRLLEELQALRLGPDKGADHRHAKSGSKKQRPARSNLSKVGQTLARLPLEPRIGRLLIAGRDNNCMTEMLVLCAALSTIDPRERPQAKRDEADALHKRFTDQRSDFVTLLKLWKYVQQKRTSLSTSAFQKMMRREFLAPQRLNDWFDVQQQLKAIAADSSFELNAKPASFESIHRALLTAFATNVGVHSDKGLFNGTRQRQFRIFPGSGLAHSKSGSKAKFIVAAELIETGKVYARLVAEVKPQWAVNVARHLVLRDYYEPYFDTQSGSVKAYETASLQGLRLTDRRPIPYAKIDPVKSRSVFLEDALVARGWSSNLPFAPHNDRVIAECETIAARLRRPELLCIDDALTELFAPLVPDNVASVRDFEKWYSAADEASREGLQLAPLAALVEVPGEAELALFPDRISAQGNQFAVRYHFCPGTETDGLEVLVPEDLQAILPEYIFDDLVPGLLAEKCTALLKALPKSKRKPLVPVADAVNKLLGEIAAGGGPLTHRLARVVAQHYRVQIEPQDWDPGRLPDYLFANVSTVDANGKTNKTRRWRSTPALPASASAAAATASASGGSAKASTGDSRAHYFQRPPYDVNDVKAASYPDLPAQFSYQTAGLSYAAFPGFVVRGEHVSSCLFYEAKEGARASGWALSRLFQNADPALVRQYRGRFLNSNKDKLALSIFPGAESIRERLLQRLFYQAFSCDFSGANEPPRTIQAFRTQQKLGRRKLADEFLEWSELFASMIDAHYSIIQAAQSVSSAHFQPALEDVKLQLKGLLCEEFLAWVPSEALRHYPRYLLAMAERLQRLREQQGRDAERQQKVMRWHDQLIADQQSPEIPQHLLRQPFFWLLQEYRVSLFAQRLGTAEPVSETRLRNAWESRFEKK